MTSAPSLLRGRALSPPHAAQGGCPAGAHPSDGRGAGAGAVTRLPECLTGRFRQAPLTTARSLPASAGVGCRNRAGESVRLIVVGAGRPA